MGPTKAHNMEDHNKGGQRILDRVSAMGPTKCYIMDNRTRVRVDKGF